jgi:hypothetical protein
MCIKIIGWCKTMKNLNNYKISISKGNTKLGAIPSVSLPACVTCNPDAPCFKECYARRIEYRYKNSRDAYAHNLQVLKENPGAYWLQVKASAIMTKFFRYHVSGDIPNLEYFKNMCALASELKTTNFLAFTKQYKIVNNYLNAGGCIPQNLKIIFSNWGAWKCANPYNLPVCEVIHKNEVPAEAWKVCGGNCTECACRGIGCWEVKNGETIAIYKH